MRPFFLPAAALLALAACASEPPSPAPAVSIVNSLTFDHALSGKRDGVRTAWPMEQLAQSTELFPLAQIKRCASGGASGCQWGVLKVSRTMGEVLASPQGVTLDVELVLDVDRSQTGHGSLQDAAMTVPADVGALQLKRVIRQRVVLEYGKVQQIAAEHGIGYALCAQRLDAARQPLEQCPIDYI
jgi:hypothetical protein